MTKKESQLNKVENEVRELNISLKKLGDEKESKYKEKGHLEGRLNTLIARANELKTKKGKVDQKTGELKKLREEKNKSVQNLIKELQKAKKKFAPSKKQLERRKSVKKGIRDLEFVVQTEVLNFKKEKEYMSKIKLLKAELTALNKDLGQLSEIKNVRDLIKNAKEEADNYHEKIQSSAKESTGIFQELTIISKQIGDIKRERSKMRGVLKSMKTQINQLNANLSKNLSYLGTLPRATGKVVFSGAKAGSGILQRQTEAVREKFKKKKKLSKEDILLLQKEAFEKEKSKRFKKK